jgi:hypothetical protein
MRNLHRTTRIQLRCTPHEAQSINVLALNLGLSLADFIRDAVTIAVANDPDRSKWDRKLATAIMRIADRSPWTTS